ncbi:hypothetical protein [Metabacillus sp. B2-18]|uniref:hypothetical protein n=1 Tax=Metabacillus sp. B2-18 TaxID=2897333 RepID=UPI001E59C42E|nr:hypothetical protein [Metabacillus sp. B2-18]UGB30559.1 hypothetical protein LPC09_23155 [Metabacillus sp. B2-18]
MKSILRVLLFTMVTTLFVSSVSATTNPRYKDADNLGNMLNDRKAMVEEAINDGDLVKVNELYDDFTTYIKKTERAIGKVPGKSNRDNLLKTYVRPSKITKERVIYEVSQIRLMKIIENLQKNGKREEAIEQFSKLERLKKRAVEIKNAGGYQSLPIQISEYLVNRERVLDTYNNPDNNEEAQQALKAIQDAQKNRDWTNITVETFIAAGVARVNEDNLDEVIAFLTSLDPGVGTSDSEELSANVAEASKSILEGVYIGQKLYTGNGQVLYIMSYDSFAFGLGYEGQGVGSYPIVGTIKEGTNDVFAVEYSIIDGPYPTTFTDGSLTIENGSIVWSFTMEGTENYSFSFPL